MHIYMNKNIVVLFILVVIVAATFYILSVVKPTSPHISIGDRELIDVVLYIDAPFSAAIITIQENGTVVYSAKQRGKEESKDTRAISKIQFSELANLIEESDFLDMRNRNKIPGDPEDGSTYTIIIRILPEGDPALADPATYSVSCYQFGCESNFLKIKEKIIELWGKDILEVGV
jgi:hypothetical protein